MPTAPRHVFFLSDGTGITAETLGNTLLTQFDGVEFKKTTLPFINTPDKARNTVEYINFISDEERRAAAGVQHHRQRRGAGDPARGQRPVHRPVRPGGTHHREAELGIESTHAQGRAHGMADQRRYTSRIDAMNYAMEHDDGQSSRDLPTRRHHPDRALALRQDADQPVPGAAARPVRDQLPAHRRRPREQRLPASLAGLEDKCFGLTSDPERLAQVRTERRPGSKYASLAAVRLRVAPGRAAVSQDQRAVRQLREHVDRGDCNGGDAGEESAEAAVLALGVIRPSRAGVSFSGRASGGSMTMKLIRLRRRCVASRVSAPVAVDAGAVGTSPGSRRATANGASGTSAGPATVPSRFADLGPLAANRTPTACACRRASPRAWSRCPTSSRCSAELYLWHMFPDGGATYADAGRRLGLRLQLGIAAGAGRCCPAAPARCASLPTARWSTPIGS